MKLFGREFNTTHLLVVVIIFIIGVCLLLIADDLPNHSSAGYRLLALFGAFIIIAIPAELLREFVLKDAEYERHMAKLKEFFHTQFVPFMTDSKKYGLDEIVSKMNFPELFDQLQP